MSTTFERWINLSLLFRKILIKLVWYIFIGQETKK